MSSKRILLERGEVSLVWGPAGPIEVRGVCKTEAGTEAGMENEDEDVDVFGGAPTSEEVEKKSRSKRAQKNLLTAVLES